MVRSPVAVLVASHKNDVVTALVILVTMAVESRLGDVVTSLEKQVTVVVVMENEVVEVMRVERNQERKEVRRQPGVVRHCTVLAKLSSRHLSSSFYS